MQSFASLSLMAVSFLVFAFSPAWAKGNFDGPAELPRVTVASSMAETPAPGSIVSVRPGDDLQAALDNAFCGDTIELQAGATSRGGSSCAPKAAMLVTGSSYVPAHPTALCRPRGSV